MSTKKISKKPDGIDPVTALEQRRAKNVLGPTVAAVGIIAGYDRWVSERVDYNALCDELEHQCHAVSKGNLERPEAMLITQAHTLEAIFNNLARKAWAAGDKLDVYERLLRLAFKAQGQCRATLETLASIRNPPIVVARQANISNGPQQVNNSVTITSARKNENLTNELLEIDDGKRLDTRATCPAVNVDKAMAAMGNVDRAKNH